MFKFSCSLPHDCYLAFSGGSDSSALLHFLVSNPKRKVTLVHVVYEDYTLVTQELEYVTSTAKKLSLDILIHYVGRNHTNKSKEAYWSIQRNSFFQTLDKPVLTGHNLDDALEWYIMTSTKGDMVGKLMGVQNGNVYRPFLYTKKSVINSYIEKNNVEWFRDETNLDCSITRNEIRHNVIPSIVKVNPGVYTSLLNKYENLV